MKRSLILILLLAHVPAVFWALAPPHRVDAFLPIPGQSSREPERVALQLRPEVIAVVGAPAAVTSSEPGSASSASASSAAMPAEDGSGRPAAAPASPAAVQAEQNPGGQQEAEQPRKP